MTTLKSGLVIVFLAAAAAMFFAGPGNDYVAAAPWEKPSTRSLYLQNCARCHGGDGRAQTALGRRLEAADLTSAEIKASSSAKLSRAIRNGRPQMPAFGKKLSARQVAALSAYIKRL